MSKGFSPQLRLLLAAAAAVTTAAGAAEPIKVGVPIAQSPPGSVVQGTQVRDGLEVVKDMINKQGGVLGRPIALVYEDDQGIPEKGRAAVEKLITRDKVVAIVGPHQSSNCLAEIEVAKRYDIPRRTAYNLLSKKSAPSLELVAKVCLAIRKEFSNT